MAEIADILRVVGGVKFGEHSLARLRSSFNARSAVGQLARFTDDILQVKARRFGEPHMPPWLLSPGLNVDVAFTTHGLF